MKQVVEKSDQNRFWTSWSNVDSVQGTLFRFRWSRRQGTEMWQKPRRFESWSGQMTFAQQIFGRGNTQRDHNKKSRRFSNPKKTQPKKQYQLLLDG